MAEECDALGTRRPYKEAFDLETCASILKKGCGHNLELPLLICSSDVGTESSQFAARSPVNDFEECDRKSGERSLNRNGRCVGAGRARHGIRSPTWFSSRSFLSNRRHQQQKRNRSEVGFVHLPKSCWRESESGSCTLIVT